MTPVEYAIAKFGGQNELKDALELHWTTLYQWKYRGGMIPTPQLKKILAVAKERGIAIDPGRLINGTANGK